MPDRTSLLEITAQLLRLSEPHQPFDWIRDAVGFYDAYFFAYAAAATLYLPLLFGSVRVMDKRAAFEIPKTVLILWNLFWSTFSGIVFWYLIAALPGIRAAGLHTSICTDQAIEVSHDAMRARFLFVAAKLPEMGDTAFLVLKKRKVDVLHYWHHLTVMVFCWQIVYLKFQDEGGDGTFFALMNSFIHWVMYGYYAATTYDKRFRVEAFAQCLTTAQILQMATGMAILVYRTISCGSVYVGNLAFGWIIYMSYFGLFLKYYFERYSGKKKSGGRKDTNGHNGGSDKKVTNGHNGGSDIKATNGHNGKSD